MRRRERISAGAGLLEEMRAFAVVAKSIDQEALEVAARAAGWVPLADVLDALLDPNGFAEWTWKNGTDGIDPRWVSRESRRAIADYLAERCVPPEERTAPEGADERNGHG